MSGDLRCDVEWLVGRALDIWCKNDSDDLITFNSIKGISFLLIIVGRGFSY